MPSPLPCASPGAGVLVYFPWLLQNLCFHSTIIILYFFSHPLLSSRPFVLSNCVKEVQNIFIGKHHYTAEPEKHRIHRSVRTKLQNFQKISGWFYITSHPFHPDLLSSGQPREDQPLSEDSSSVGLRCVQQERGEESRGRYQFIVANGSSSRDPGTGSRPQ